MVEPPLWTPLPGSDKLQCELCPRYCKISPGQRGACFIRGHEQGKIGLLTGNRTSGFCIDPIEKKPLNHFYPGSPVLSFGTAGCNLACKFCQNWDISKARDQDRLNRPVSAEQVARCAADHHCQSVAYTYNDPVIFYEYALEVAAACRAQRISNVAVTAGYICDAPREHFFKAMDAVNVDLKSFNQDFYWKLCGAHLATVLETIEYIYHATDCWLEITTLLIPGENDGQAELEQLCQWLLEHLSAFVPIHFSAFHPDWKMRDHPATPLATLQRARRTALAAGLKYVYTGNVHDPDGDTTFCPNCSAPVIVRDWYQLKKWALNEHGQCSQCGATIHGHFSHQPGQWGAQRFQVEPNRA